MNYSKAVRNVNERKFHFHGIKAKFHEIIFLVTSTRKLPTCYEDDVRVGSETMMLRENCCGGI